MNLKPLKIGDVVSNLPIIQGGMGIGVSRGNLAGAVASEGGIGVISSAQIGYDVDYFNSNPIRANLEALTKHINIAKEKAKGGLIGVNLMVAMNQYETYVRCCAENKVDLIISGAGLPISLPAFVKNSATKIAPIVSSVKAANVILKMWDNRYKVTADAVVIEGPKAGGHLGFKRDELETINNYDSIVLDIIEFIKKYEEKYNKIIPVIFAGGVFTHEDVLKYIDMGCAGVQVATRFVATDECDAHDNFKQAYVDAKKEDIVIVDSPVGMPGRAIRNDFVDKKFRTIPEICCKCMPHCDIGSIPYCITEALVKAVNGDTKNGLVFCGENAYRIDKITSVNKLMNELSGNLLVNGM